MAKLTDSQLIILPAAAARDDGMAVVPAKMTKAAASKVGSSLVARKLMRDVKARRGAPVWREDEEGRPIGLVITRAGRAAIDLGDRGGPHDPVNADARRPAKVKQHARRRVVTAAASHSVSGATKATPRAGSKQALIVGMLSAGSGATMAALMNATGWLPHTTRAALTGLRKRGFAVERSREGDVAVYRIVDKSTAAAA